VNAFRPLIRPLYGPGQLLTAEDLLAGLDYTREKWRLHNRFLHGWGLVSGLGVTIEGGTTVVVSPGLALDCAGNELVLDAPQRLSLAGLAGRQYVTITYAEVPESPAPQPLGEPLATRVRETVSLRLEAINPALGHRHLGPGTPGCGLPHGVCVATLLQKGADWRATPVRARRSPR
jgi:hypothetical protein